MHLSPLLPTGLGRLPCWGALSLFRLRRLTLGCLLGAAASQAGWAQPGWPAAGSPSGPPTHFTAQDVFALQNATDVQLSPDGRQVAYVRAAADLLTDRTQQSIWLLDVASGQQRQLVAAPASTPRWAPDGRRLAYVAAAPQQEERLCVQQLASGSVTTLPALPSSPGNLAWSPDGRVLACTAFVADSARAPLFRLPVAPPPGAQWALPLRVITDLNYRSDGGGDLTPGYSQLFVLAADGQGAPRQLTRGPYDAGQLPAWSPDGQYLLFGANRQPGLERDPYRSDDTEIWQVRVADGALTALTHQAGPDASPRVSPDGRRVAYLRHPPYEHGLETTQLWVMNRDGSQPRSLSAGLDRFVYEAHWTADGRQVLASYEDAGVVKVGAFDLQGHMQPLLENVADAAFTVAHTGRVGFAAVASDHPADVAVWDSRGGTRQLTHLNADLLGGKTLGQVRPLAVRSSFDQRAVGAWAVLPPGYDPARRYPAVLVMHGGPYGSYGPEWSTDFQLYAAAGYVVLFSNPRGSISYGSDYANQIWHDFPSHDADDLLSVVDAAVAQGLADSTRLFVTGGSAGGELTAWLVGKTNRFRAAVAEKPVINNLSYLLLTDQHVGAPEFDFGAYAWEKPLLYWQHSPLSLVGQVRTPTMLMVGEQDYRTPASEAMQYYAALQLRGVPTALVLVPGASHESLAARPSQHVAEMAANLAWFARYGGPVPPRP